LKRIDIVEAEIRADEAYRQTLPDLVGYEKIRDFIACITHGMATCSVTAFQASKFLYVALLRSPHFVASRVPNESRKEPQVPDPLPPPTR
jgi:hypothetical protein